MPQFILHIEPPATTAQQQKTAVIAGRVMRYDPPKVKAAKRLLAVALMQHRPRSRIDGPARCWVKWCIPYPKATPARITEDLPHYRKPDPDNAAKLLLDQLTDAGFWHDDGQVADLRFRKYWTRTPRIEIDIEPLTEQPDNLPGL